MKIDSSSGLMTTTNEDAFIFGTDQENYNVTIIKPLATKLKDGSLQSTYADLASRVQTVSTDVTGLSSTITEVNTAKNTLQTYINMDLDLSKPRGRLGSTSKTVNKLKFFTFEDCTIIYNDVLDIYTITVTLDDTLIGLASSNYSSIVSALCYTPNVQSVQVKRLPFKLQSVTPVSPTNTTSLVFVSQGDSKYVATNTTYNVSVLVSTI